jgi:GNAT superfamily N-acetyltransferase
MAAQTRIRLAEQKDIPTLRGLIALSVRGLQGSHYTPAQMEGALASVFGVDSQLIEDGTYFVVEDGGRLAACGGWSKRRTLYGGDQAVNREDSLLNPANDAARIRAFFVHPDFARRGIGTQLLKACEDAACAHGFRRFELASTLPGVALYTARGYEAGERFDIALSNGELLGILRMTKTVVL